MHTLRNVIQRFIGSFSIDTYAEKIKPFRRAQVIVRFIYFVYAFTVLNQLRQLHGYFSQKDIFTPEWSLAWTHFLTFDQVLLSLEVLLLFSVFIALFFFTHRIGRIVVFASVFFLDAFMSSFIFPDHTWYIWIYVLFLLIFLPDVQKKQEATWDEKKKFLLVFFSTQVAILAVYSIVGLGKTSSAITQYLNGEIHGFSFEALSLHVAYWFSVTKETGLLGSYIITHPLFGWVFWVGSIYLQVFSLWVAFRPSLHKLWGFGLLLIHIGTLLAMNILYLSFPVFLILLFFYSPFEDDDESLMEKLTHVPIFGPAVAFFYKRLFS
ncbi:hypothetical protein HQ403_02130 [Candidatus Kaiserbacteria bacterium]|nr:hypothetical protein [Candidatus Kaiserbacteria bacterium]